MALDSWIEQSSHHPSEHIGGLLLTPVERERTAAALDA
jgi:hypothetical protein